MNIDEKIRKLKKELKIAPNIKEWGKHIKNLCDQGKMEKAHGCIKDMMRHGMEPNVQIFTTLINGWCKVDKMSVAMNVTKFMRNIGVEPNEVTFNTLIHGYCNRHDMMMAKKIMEIRLRTLRTLVIDVSAIYS